MYEHFIEYVGLRVEYPTGNTGKTDGEWSDGKLIDTKKRKRLF